MNYGEEGEEKLELTIQVPIDPPTMKVKIARTVIMPSSESIV